MIGLCGSFADDMHGWFPWEKAHSRTATTATTIVAGISLKAQRRILFRPLDGNIDTSAERLGS